MCQLSYQNIHYKQASSRRGNTLPNGLVKYYQTVNDKAISEYPPNDQDKILDSAFWTDQENISFLTKKKQTKTIKKHFNKKIGPKTTKLFYFTKVLFRVSFDFFFGDILQFVMLYFVLSFVVFTS